MSRGADIPIRTFSPITDRTDTSMSSPIMMLWLDFLVRTSILRASLLLPSRTGNPLKQVRPRDAMKTSGSVELTAGSAVVGAIHPAACTRLRRADGTTFAAPAAQPDPDVGPPRTDRRLDRPPTRGHGPAD